MYRIVITGPASRDIQEAYDWWAENRSRDQATRWYLAIHNSIALLQEHPQRCSLAPEADLQASGVRQFLFGTGRRRTHRIVFGIDGNTVVIFRVRHTSQDALVFDDLA
mgnify:FL=1